MQNEIEVDEMGIIEMLLLIVEIDILIQHDEHDEFGIEVKVVPLDLVEKLMLHLIVIEIVIVDLLIQCDEIDDGVENEQVDEFLSSEI